MSTPVLDDALRLPVPERIELVQAIWDSIVAESASGADNQNPDAVGRGPAAVQERLNR